MQRDPIYLGHNELLDQIAEEYFGDKPANQERLNLLTMHYYQRFGSMSIGELKAWRKMRKEKEE